MVLELLWFLAEIGLCLIWKDVDDGGGRRLGVGAYIFIPVALFGLVYVVWTLLPEHPWMVAGILGGTGAVIWLLWLGRHKPRRRRRYRGHMPGPTASER